MDKEEKMLRQLLREKGYDVDGLFESDALNEKERKEQLASILADIIKTQSNNSTKRYVAKQDVDGDNFYLGFLADMHSKMYLAEDYLKRLDAVGGKCVVAGDVSNGSNHFKGHDGSMKETLNLTNDILSMADIMKRYPDMFVGYVEGNHDQWITEGTSLLLGYIACKIAGIDSIYAKNVELITQNVTSDGKVVPFNFLLVHGEGMSANIVNSLKKSLIVACRQNVDAIIFGHTHKMGSSSATVFKKTSTGWQEKQVMSYNPGTFLEAGDYADKAGYPPITPFDGSVLHCHVVKDKISGQIKKCIDVENIMNVLSKKDSAKLALIQSKLRAIESKKYASKDEIVEAYKSLIEHFFSKNIKFERSQDGHYFVGISGLSEMYSPRITESMREKIRKDLQFAVNIIKDIPNVSVVLNGDFIFDYNKGYISKKDYCANIIADLQDLCELLKPIAPKIKAINYGKMEESIMNLEIDKGNGRIGGGKKKLKELANYASQVLQLDERDAYAPYNKQEMRTRQLAIQNSQVNEANQKMLDKKYEALLKKLSINPALLSQYIGTKGGKHDPETLEKKLKEALVKQLRSEHLILDISDENDRKKIDELYPLSAIDLRMPNENLIANIVCKLLNMSNKSIKINAHLNEPSTFFVKDTNGKTKKVSCYYCTSLGKFLNELPAKLNSIDEPADIIILNNPTKSGSDLQEFTTQIRMSYFDSNGTKRLKDVLVIDSGSFGYNKSIVSGKVPTNMVYKVVDVEPIFKSVLPTDSVNYQNSNTRQVVEKYNYESLQKHNSPVAKSIKSAIKTSLAKALDKFDEQQYKSSNAGTAKQVVEGIDAFDK